MSIDIVAGRVNQKLSDSREYLNKSSTAMVSPKSAKGLSGWEFDIPTGENITLSSDITDNYVENNSYINEHIVRKPIRINLSGLKGELVYKKPAGIQGSLQDLNNRLEIVEAYLGDFTPGMVQSIQRGINQAQLAVSQINSTLDQTQNILSALSGEGQEETLQQRAYNELQSLYYTNQILTVQTPWRFFESMVIEELSFSQGEETENISEISISLKEWRTADLEINSFEEKIFPVREEVQISEEENIGVVKGKPVSILLTAARGVGAVE